jgi:hypothetical protein
MNDFLVANSINSSIAISEAMGKGMRINESHCMKKEAPAG